LILLFGIVANLMLLAYFKYSDFLIENIDLLFHVHIPMLHLMLPLAISFFTFQQIAYLVDSYRQETKEYDFLNYVLFVTFFPQLIAGPIVHHSQMMPQFRKNRNKIINYHHIVLGLFIFSIGLFKKAVIADAFAVWATQGFDVVVSPTFYEAWVSSLSYTFQLYFDFSGYTDMAIGAALLFNIRLPINFNSPYKALSIQGFWRRWHITLSQFLRDYIYIPLGGNRRGKVRVYFNLIITFVLGGIWHGAGWTFIFWGLMHGMALGVQKLWQKIGFHISTFFAWFITFNFVNISWVFFRAKEWSDATKILKAMFDFHHIAADYTLADMTHFLTRLVDQKLKGIEVTDIVTFDSLMYLTVFGILAFLLPNSMQISRYIPYNGKLVFKENWKWAFLFAFIVFISLLVSFFGSEHVSEFLYFNF